MRAISWAVAGVAIMFATADAGRAGVITFDDITTRNNFFQLGIESSYQGFHWGFSHEGGLGNGEIPQVAHRGWAAATTSNHILTNGPTPVSGNSYAWNWSVPQSLLIDFLTPQDVTSGYFAKGSPDVNHNASTIELLGYDEGGSLTAATSPLSLSHSFQLLQAEFNHIRYLEIRADAPDRLFAIDDLTVAPSSGPVQLLQSTPPATVPEPSSLAAFLIEGLGIGASRIRRRQIHRRRQQLPA